MEQEIETKQDIEAKQEVEKNISPRELRLWGSIALLLVFLNALQIWTRTVQVDCAAADNAHKITAPANITVN